MQVQLSLLLDRSRLDTLTRQLVVQIRDAIRVGRVRPGTQLPSTRRLSEQLGIGRNTVTRAYEILQMECYLEARPAAGMFATVPPSLVRPGAPEPGPGAVRREQPVQKGGAPATTKQAPARSAVSVDFVPGRPDPALFPLKPWRRLLEACLSRGGALGLSHPVDPSGLSALRSAVANHLSAARGIVADPALVIIVGSASEALALAARLLLRPGSHAAIESPGYGRAAQVFEAAGAELRGVAVDNDGIVPADLPDGPTDLLYVTPSHQYPTGHTLPMERRKQVVAWARARGCYIFEDDFGSDIRYDGGQPHAVAAIAPESTLHFGSFSQALGAGLRLGYLLVPPSLAEAAGAARALLTAGCSWLEQAALAEMISNGSYGSHLMRMRIAYRERRDQLVASLRRHFGEVELGGEEGGMHLFWQLPPGVPDASTTEALARRARVGVYTLAGGNTFVAQVGAASRRGLILGYASLTPRQIEQGISRLSDAVDDALDLNRVGVADLLAHRPAAPRPFATAQGRRAKPAPKLFRQPALPLRPVSRTPSPLHAAEGPDIAMPAVTGLFRYPIKGLSPQPMATVRLEAGRPFPFDRVFALARPGVAIDPDQPKWAKKGLFVMLMLDEGLATVRTHLDEATLHLTVSDGTGSQVLTVDLTDPDARHRAEAFFHDLVPTLRVAPRLVRSRDGHFMDKPDSVLSLINLATVRSLERQWGVTLDPMRFRANIYVDGVAPWAEFDWVGGDIRLGEAVFHVDRRNGRCGATNVDPATGRRDLEIPRSLRNDFGHKDLGVYLVTRTGGTLSVGDPLELPGVKPARTVTVAVPGPQIARAAHICRGCYFIYEDAKGQPPGVPAGTAFATLPGSWKCPDCGSDKAMFRPHMP